MLQWIKLWYWYHPDDPDMPELYKMLAHGWGVKIMPIDITQAYGKDFAKDHNIRETPEVWMFDSPNFADRRIARISDADFLESIQSFITKIQITIKDTLK
jgi:hypothetical protein